MRKPMSGVCRQSTPGLRGRFERYTSRQAFVEFFDADGEDYDRHGQERQDLVPEIGDPQSYHSSFPTAFGGESIIFHLSSTTPFQRSGSGASDRDLRSLTFEHSSRHGFN